MVPQHRRGFGKRLDRKGFGRCILLVSHQEEFADTFADGYRFELDNGATRVTRFQR